MATEQEVEARVLSKNLNATKEETQQFYDEWALVYDKEVSVIRYNSPELSANVFQKFVASKNARILDVAAGTGLAGEELQKLGFNNIDAIDGSPISIEAARRKQIYNNVYVEWIEGGKRLNFDDDVYDAIIAVGCFGLNCMGSDCFPELIRIVKPGGIVVFGTRSKWLTLVPNYSNGKLEADMKKMEKAGKWKFIEQKIHNKEDEEQVTTFVFLVS